MSEAIKTGERGVLLERLKSSVTCDSEYPELSNLRSFKKSDRTALKKSSGAEVKTSWWWPVQTAKSEGRGNFGWQRWKSGKVAGSGRRMLPLHRSGNLILTPGSHLKVEGKGRLHKVVL